MLPWSCLKSTFAWCESHGRELVQITRLLAGPSSTQGCQGGTFRESGQHVRGHLAPGPPLSQRRSFWQGWWLQEPTSEERHMYDEKKREGLTQELRSSQCAPAMNPAHTADLSTPATRSRSWGGKLVQRVRDLWRRQKKTTTTYGSQKLKILCQGRLAGSVLGACDS